MVDQRDEESQEHLAPVQVYVQGPNGTDMVGAHSVQEARYSEAYGELRHAYRVSAGERAYIYSFPADGAEDFKEYSVEFESGVLKVLGRGGKLIDAFAPGAWSKVGASTHI